MLKIYDKDPLYEIGGDDKFEQRRQDRLDEGEYDEDIGGFEEIKMKNLKQAIRRFCNEEEGFCTQDISKFFEALSTGENIQTESGREYRILNDRECWEAVTEEIENSAWALRPEFLSSATGLDRVIFEKLSELCENSNDAVLALIRQTCGMADLVASAVNNYGFGAFLAHYDGRELEIAGTDLLLFRVN